MTMTLSNAFFTPTADGTVERIEPPDPKLRHAVVAVGYGERASTNFVLVRNHGVSPGALRDTHGFPLII